MDVAEVPSVPLGPRQKAPVDPLTAIVPQLPPPLPPSPTHNPASVTEESRQVPPPTDATTTATASITVVAELQAENRRLRQEHVVTLDKLAVLQQQVSQQHRQLVRSAGNSNNSSLQDLPAAVPKNVTTADTTSNTPPKSTRDAAVNTTAAVHPTVPPPAPPEEDPIRQLKLQLGRQRLELASLLEQNEFLRAENSRLLAAHNDSLSRAASPHRHTRVTHTVETQTATVEWNVKETEKACGVCERLVATVRQRAPILRAFHERLRHSTDFPISQHLLSAVDSTSNTNNDTTAEWLAAWLEEFLTAVDYYTARAETLARDQLQQHRDTLRQLLAESGNLGGGVASAAEAKVDGGTNEQSVRDLSKELAGLVAALRDTLSAQQTAPAKHSSGLAGIGMEPEAIPGQQWQRLVQESAQRHFGAEEETTVGDHEDSERQLLLRWIAESARGSATMQELTDAVEQHVHAAATVKREKAALEQAVAELTDSLDTREKAWLVKYRRSEAEVARLNTLTTQLNSAMRHYREEYDRVLAVSPMRHTAVSDEDNSSNETAIEQHPLPFRPHFQYVLDSLTAANHALAHARQQQERLRTDMRTLQTHRDALQRQRDTDQQRMRRLQTDCDQAGQRAAMVQHAVDEVAKQYEDAVARNSELEQRLYRVCDAFQRMVVAPL